MSSTGSPAVQEDRERSYREPAVRLARLLDVGSVVPLHDEDASGVSAVRGRVAGKDVVAFCTDALNMGGAMGAEGCRWIVAAIDTAVREGVPVIGLWHSGGARLADGVESMDGVGRVFRAMTRASGRVPQISVVLGPAAGAAAYGPALTDVVIMSSSGRMFVTGPDVVRAVTGEQVDMKSLGGPAAHGRKSGVAHVVVESEADAYQKARRFTELFTGPDSFDLESVHDGGDLGALLPENPRRAYDVRPLVRELLDGRAFEEMQPHWAANIVTGLGRLAGRTVGVVASNPLRKGGCLDALSAEKASRFVRMCDALGIPLVVIVDVPGYLPGVDQEWDGVIRRGAKLLHAFAEAVVPRVTLVTRKSYGGAYIAMNSRSLGATAVFAWPQAEVAVMSADAAVGILHRKRLAAAPDEDREALRLGLVRDHIQTVGGVGRALALGVVDEVVEPAHTRQRIAEALAASPARRGGHGNIPL
ncbi:carboxyl transferase domain-containing protein [Nonomuraea sp. NPDC000554]|uniref:acyl-CoA carboxylase subunit beta n=1 Tax=Nonomuraea sp. NPDC000554 TaxID=3154259 RepID=UPI0033177171